MPINVSKVATSDFALFNLGFRPFFLGAALHSIVIMLIWMLTYGTTLSLPMTIISIYQWHAHEMIYGYAMAVIAGFLLTAIKNWTGIQTAQGLILAIIFSLWLSARVLFLFGATYIGIAGIFDLLFMFSLSVAIAHPIIKAKSWKQLGILSTLILLLIFNACFYLGAMGILKQGLYFGVYGGFYIIISLILLISSKVIPFFIERGVAKSVQINNPRWITILGLFLFSVFFISELFLHDKKITGFVTMALFIVYSIRLMNWYTTGIWKNPLLWGLYLAMLCINIGFLLFALSSFIGVSKFLAIHAIAYGGIGVITISMMARVALGHTGRNINQPPNQVKYTLVLLLFGVIVRVLLPIIAPAYYFNWIIISQIIWSLAFLLFLISYSLILIKPRVDGKLG